MCSLRLHFPAFRNAVILVASLVLATYPAAAELVFDLTKVKLQPAPQATEAVARFTFKNTGASPVRIAGMESDCTCTVPTVERQVYAPGEVGEVVVKYDIGYRQGVQKGIVFVATESPAAGSAMLVMELELPTVISASTTYLAWRAGAPMEEQRVTVKLAPEAAVQEVRATSPNSTLRIIKEQTGDHTFVVKVTPVRQAAPYGLPLYLDAVLAGGAIKRVPVLVQVQ